MILQDPMASLNPLFTIGDQVAEPIRVHEGTSKRRAWERATELLRAVRITAPETRVGEYPHQMSGGMRQRIVGAMAIACEPQLLIADEPTTSLDLTIQAQYLALLRDLQREHGLGADLHHPQPRHRRQDVRPRRRDVRGAARRVRSGAKDLRRAPAPYTRALLQSIPRFGDSRQRLTAIGGQPPDLSALPLGCSFHPRCPDAIDQCRAEAPPETGKDAGHVARCWVAPQ